jgi:signal peptidase I
MNPDNSYKELLFLDGVDIKTAQQLAATSRRRKDMILVSKFAYWFRVPDRGDIAVFKVPDRPHNSPSGSTFDPLTPVYIKRVVGLPGETITIQPPKVTVLPLGHANRRSNRLGGVELLFRGEPVLVNGEAVSNPELDKIVHFPPPDTGSPFMYAPRQENIQKVGEDGVLMIGDNAASSLDGRYWGDVPRSHLRGRAVLRYLPLGAWHFF